MYFFSTVNKKSENTRLSHKDFIAGMVLSIMTIIACVAAMFSSALAFFHTDIKTENSYIAGAYYAITLDNAANGTYICPLAYDDLHLFEITYFLAALHAAIAVSQACSDSAA